MPVKLRTGRPKKSYRPAGADKGKALVQPVRVGRSLAGRDVLFLQRSVGNQAVGRLVAPPVQRDSNESTKQKTTSPLPPNLLSHAQTLIQDAKRNNKPKIVKDMTEFIKTGILPVLEVKARIMAQPQFLAASIIEVHRGARIKVLYSKGSWLRVQYRGREGWMHRNRLIPKIIHISSGNTGSGTARGEAEFGGRG